jgi:hypothetical protein
LIRSETANKVSQTMAEAQATRPAVVGGALSDVAVQDPEILQAVMDVMEAQQLLASQASVELLPDGANVLVQLQH